MKTLVLIISILFAWSLTLYSQVTLTKKIVKGNTETYEKSSTKYTHAFRNINSISKDLNYEKNQFGEAEITFPENKFIYNAITNTFTSAELNVLAREKSRMYIHCIIYVNGTVEISRITVTNDSIITPQKIELLEKTFTNYKVEVSKLSSPNVKYTAVTMPILFGKFLDGTYKY